MNDVPAMKADTMAVQDPGSKTVVRTVFIALVLDLLAFTMPLPLFPRLIAWYLERETLQHPLQGVQGVSLLARLLKASHTWRSYLLSWSGATGTLAKASGKNWDVVLLGGAMGSLFSLCQCVISPWLGGCELVPAQIRRGLTDSVGYVRPEESSAHDDVGQYLVCCNLAAEYHICRSSAWRRTKADGQSTYLLSRIVGGLSEGNVQLSTAIISDVTDSVSRPRSLALVGIAFSICFTLGYVLFHKLHWDETHL